jgi:hypothetical protein
MDVSPRITEIVGGYGGSDRVAPNFSTTRYVRYGSTTDPLDLGGLPGGDVILDGVIGGESGANTLYFKFRLNEPARLAARIVPLQRYRDQYISLSLADEEGDWRAAGGEGYATLPFPFIPDELTESILNAQSYVNSNYWAEGYALSEGFSDRLAATTIRTDARLIPVSDIMPSGLYRVVVSSSQWPALPFRLQLSSRGAVRLSGDADLALSASLRTSLVRLGGSVTLPITPTARIRGQRRLSGEAGLALAPAGTLSRVSPFGA